MRDKKSYISIIFDLEKKPSYKDSYTSNYDSSGNLISTVKKKFAGYSKKYLNQRWGIYCKCGYCTESSVDNICLKGDNFSFKENVNCLHCNEVYNSNSNLRFLNSKNTEANVVSRRFAFVEKKDFYALYSFATSVMISVTTKKLIFKDHGNLSLYVSKKNKAIKLRIGKGIKTIPLKNLTVACLALIDELSSNLLYEDMINQNDFEKRFIQPLLDFSNAVEQKCDQRDVQKILMSLNDNQSKQYFESFFKESTTRGFNYPDFFKHDYLYDWNSFNRCSENISAYRYIWIQYFKQRIPLMLSIYLYPPLATLAISYGSNKLLNLFQKSTLMCSLTDLLRKKPTNPKDILEIMFKNKILTEFHKNKKIKKDLQKENKKRVRKFTKNSPKIIRHPTLFNDSRVPINKNIKIQLKSIKFKKLYVDLFLHRFDSAATLFYGFLNNQSSFDNIETLNRILYYENFGTIQRRINLLFEIQNSFQHIERRLENFKIDFKTAQHLFKLNDSNLKDFTRLLHCYIDSIYMLQTLNLPIDDIFKIKSYTELNNLHDNLNKTFQLKSDERINTMLKKHVAHFKHTEVMLNKISFSILDTPERFYDESDFMNHCVKTYYKCTAEGKYIIYSVVDSTTNDRATLSISLVGNDGYYFDQLKAKHNQKTTVNIISATRKFLEKYFKIDTEQDKCDLLITEEMVSQTNSIF